MSEFYTIKHLGETFEAQYVGMRCKFFPGVPMLKFYRSARMVFAVDAKKNYAIGSYVVDAANNYDMETYENYKNFTALHKSR